MPRPRKSKEHRRSCIVVFRVTQSQFDSFAQKGNEANLGVHDIARIAALSNLDRIVVETVAAVDPALLKRLDRIGHNLNQLVKNAHIFGRVSPKADELLERIERLVDVATKE